MPTIQDLQTRQNPNWCPGCGNFGIQAAIKAAIVELDIEPENVAIATGIGCGSKINQWIETYGLATLHGRPLPSAMGIKLANPELTVIAAGGDGDGYGIGMGHFINTMRRNIDITYIVQDNQIYELTLGQTSPTSEKGSIGPSTPHGVCEWPVNPIRLALSSECTYVARGFSGDIQHLSKLVVEGIKHKGFSLIDVFQPCVTFNKVNTFQYFNQRVYKLEETDGYDTSDLNLAFKKAGEWGDKIPIGLFYQKDHPSYEDCDPALKTGKNPTKEDISNVDIKQILDSFL